jgi:hypothetical protein
VAWHGVVYGSAPLMSWLAQRTQLSPALEQRKRSEQARERLVAALRPVAIGSAVLDTVAICAAVVVVGLGAVNPGRPSNPFGLDPDLGASR